MSSPLDPTKVLEKQYVANRVFLLPVQIGFFSST